MSYKFFHNSLKFLSFLGLSLALSGCEVTPLYNDNFATENIGIRVDVIADRDGQLLRQYLRSGLRDLKITSEKYRLNVKLESQIREFADTINDNSQRKEVKYTAHTILKNSDGKIVFEKNIIATTSNNIASGHGGVIFSLYGRNNRNLMKELSVRIIESLKIYMGNAQTQTDGVK